MDARRPGRGVWRLALALTVAALLACRGHAPAAPPRLDWLFVYVMPYDNDLDHCSGTITDALARGAYSRNVAVALFADGRAPDGLHRRLFRAGHGVDEPLPDAEDSADPQALAGFLDWAVARAPARRYVLVFLDHGGMLDQMGYDERPGRADDGGGPRPRWLSARATGEALRAWRARHHGLDVPLLFLQQCGRSAVEGLMDLRGAADAVLGSQQSVGACNTYYEALLAYASQHPSADARALAAVVMAEDRDYESYTLTRTAALEEFPAQADALVAALMGGAEPDAGAGAGAAGVTHAAMSGLTPCFSSGLEQFYDLLEVVEAAAGPGAARTPAAQRAAQSFGAWVRERLVIDRRARSARAAAWCGVATQVPALGALVDLYRAQPVYRETRWDDLVRALAGEGGMTIVGRVPRPAHAP